MKSHPFVATLILGAVILAGCGDEDDAEIPVGTSTIAGTVENLYENSIMLAAVPGIEVTLIYTDADGNTAEADAVTDEEGRFVFADIAAGTYTIEFSFVTADGREGETTFEITVAEGERIDLIVDLSYGASISRVPDEVVVTPVVRKPQPTPSPPPPPPPSPPVNCIASGTVTFVDTEVAGTFSIGMSFTLEYTFYPDADYAVVSPTDRVYTGAVDSVTITIGPYVATAASGDIPIADNNPNDSYGMILAGISGASVNGRAVYGYQPVLDLIGNATALSSLDLPPDPPDPADFSVAKTLMLAFDDPLAPSGRVGAAATVQSIMVK